MLHVGHVKKYKCMHIGVKCSR